VFITFEEEFTPGALTVTFGEEPVSSAKLADAEGGASAVTFGEEPVSATASTPNLGLSAE
jgi:hypothetical protein